MARQETVFSYVSYIRSTPEAVFEAITRPELSRQFWEHENISDWKPGSTWQHIRDSPERSVEIVGEVMEAASPHRLVTSWAAASQSNDPASYSRVTYEIEDFGSLTRLTVTHDRLQPGSGMAAGVSRGWPLVLSSLKSFLETSRGIDLAAKPTAA